MDFPGKSTGVGCHCLLRDSLLVRGKGDAYKTKATFEKLQNMAKLTFIFSGFLFLGLLYFLWYMLNHIILSLLLKGTQSMIWKDTRTLMVTAALFTEAKTWKQPKHPSTEEWMKEMWYIHSTEYYSAIKNGKIMPFAATWNDLEIITLSKSEKSKYHIISLLGSSFKDLSS